MKAKNAKKRALTDLGYPVAAGVIHAIHLLEERYGPSDYHDSGHTQTAPTWIFKLPSYGNAEVGVRMNKRDITLYVRDRTCDGKRLRDILPAGNVVKVYPRDGKPANSILNSNYLGPSTTNEVLMLELEPEDVGPTLAAFFGDAADGTPAPLFDADVSSTSARVLKSRRPGLTEEDFALLLDRRSETGRAGEFLVVQDELKRLRLCGCPAPEQYVHRISMSDVGRGYDIESTWPHEERCIEVKTTTEPGSDFYLTTNERSVLTELGERAWLYRVVINSQGAGRIEMRLRNPMKRILDEQMRPVVWRVPALALNPDD
jgi:hypothetical protein